MRRGGDDVLASVQTLHENAAAALGDNPHITPQRLAIEGHENELFPVAIADGWGRHKNALRLLGAGLFVFLGLKFHRGIHVRPEICVRIQNLHLDLYRGFGPVGLGRDFGNHAVVLAIGEGIDGDRPLLLRAKLGEIILRDIELDLKIVAGRPRLCWQNLRSRARLFPQHARE